MFLDLQEGLAEIFAQEAPSVLDRVSRRAMLIRGKVAATHLLATCLCGCGTKFLQASSQHMFSTEACQRSVSHKRNHVQRNQYQRARRAALSRMRITVQRFCRECAAPLPIDAPGQRKFCSPPCHRAQSRRLRAPEHSAAYRNQAIAADASPRRIQK